MAILPARCSSCHPTNSVINTAEYSVVRETTEHIDGVQMIDIRPLFEKEMSKGKPSGPVFVNGWPMDCDPRFTPVNPLYDPYACRDTDWRSKLDIVGYLRFSDYVAHSKGMLYRYVLESEEDENIFDVSFPVFLLYMV